MNEEAKVSQPGSVTRETELVTDRPKRPYEPPRCEKKRSIHRVTLLSGMGVTSVGVLSMTG